MTEGLVIAEYDDGLVICDADNESFVIAETSESFVLSECAVVGVGSGGTLAYVREDATFNSSSDVLNLTATPIPTQTDVYIEGVLYSRPTGNALTDEYTITGVQLALTSVIIPLLTFPVKITVRYIPL